MDCLLNNRYVPGTGWYRCSLFSLILFWFLVAALVGTSHAGGSGEPVVRLLLEENGSRIVVSGVPFLLEREDQGGWQNVITRARRAGFSRVKGSIHLEGTSVVSSIFRVKPLKGLLTFAGKPSRGDLYILPGEDGIMVVSHMPLESYLAGVVNGEIDSSWPMEAVKAQVVAARTYAVFRMKNSTLPYDLKTDVSDQVYAGVESEDERAVTAVEATRGEVLYRDEELIQAFFHSSCGGTTASALEVWGVAQLAQESVYCGECEDAPFARWRLPLAQREIRGAIRALYPDAGEVYSVGIHRRGRDGRVRTLFAETTAGRILIDAGELRKVLGYKRLPSTKFSLGLSGGRIILTGEGYGHGVGLCQWGARGSALKGLDYRQILRKYYVGAEIKKIY